MQLTYTHTKAHRYNDRNVKYGINNTGEVYVDFLSLFRSINSFLFNFDFLWNLCANGNTNGYFLLFPLLTIFLKNSTICKNRRLADEDDELSEVQPDAVPPEVREWLASTFTRQLATTRKKSDEKPKFRSVAHAIRAGIFVDRIYRRVSSTALMQFPPEVVKVLKVNILWSN